MISLTVFLRLPWDTEAKFTDLKAEEVSTKTWRPFSGPKFGISVHWQPFATFCSPCRLLPQIILKLETLDEEFPFVLEWSGLSRVYGVFTEFPRDNAALGNTKETTEELIAQLTRKQMDGLLEFYKDDIAIGGYSTQLRNVLWYQMIQNSHYINIEEISSHWHKSRRN